MKITKFRLGLICVLLSYPLLNFLLSKSSQTVVRVADCPEPAPPVPCPAATVVPCPPATVVPEQSTVAAAACAPACVEYKTYPCSVDTTCVNCDQFATLRVLKRFRRFLVMGTLENQDWSPFPVPPPDRFDTMRYTLAYIEKEARRRKDTLSTEPLIITELGTGRSFTGSMVPEGINNNDPSFWHVDKPEDWDWGAGSFTNVMGEALEALGGRSAARFTTVDLMADHIERNKVMTSRFGDLLEYKVQSSTVYLSEFEGQFDVLYMDTADIWPIEPSATLHLEEAQIIVERDLMKDGGLLLIDDVANQTPKKFGEDSNLGKSKYSIPYLLDHGFEMIIDGYQVIMRKKPLFAFHRQLSLPDPTARLRVLHITFHKGCEREIEYVGETLGVDVQTVFLQSPVDGNFKYNINKRRAKLFFKQLEADLLRADVVVTSDTAPLSRILLQNGYAGPLIIWVCNRFDYADGPALDPDNIAGTDKFPDEEYYNQLRRVGAGQPRVAVVGYTAFENVYARKHRQVDIGSFVIKPTGGAESKGDTRGAGDMLDGAPAALKKTKKDTFLVPPYENDKRLPVKCEELSLACYRGRYDGPDDVLNYRAVLHVPYAWSNFALFEFFSRGIVMFIPTKRFLLTMDNIFWSPPYDHEELDKSEWYDPRHASLFVFFDSWDALASKANAFTSEDRQQMSKRIVAFSNKHRTDMLNLWRNMLFKV